MGLALVKRMFGKKMADEEENVAEKVFGNIFKFRIGSPVTIKRFVTDLFPEDTLFNQVSGEGFEQLSVASIASFEFDGAKIYRLFCENPNCVVQIHEESDDEASVMLFILTQEEWLTERADVDSWSEFISGDSIDNDGTVYNKVFGPLEYDQKLEADKFSSVKLSTLSYTMSLFDRDVGDDDDIEYMLFTLGQDDGWELNGYVGINIPTEEITIL